MNALLSLAALAASLSMPNGRVSAMEAGLAIENDFPTFREQVQKTAPMFSASRVEKIFEVEGENGGRYCLVDFDGSNGYCLLGDSLEMVGMVYSGNFDYGLADGPFSSSFLSFSNGYHPFSEQSLFSQGKIRSPIRKIAFSGTPSLSDYVANKYGAGFSGVESRALSDWPYVQNEEYSVYSESVGSSSFKSEDNCLLSSLYKSLLRAKKAFPAKGLSPIPTGEVSIGEGDSFRQSLLAERNSGGSPRFYPFHNQAPEAYKDIRDYFIANDGYRVGPATFSKGADCISQLSGKYGVSITASFGTDLSFQSDAVETITRGGDKEIIWMPTGGEYAYHAMNVTGYSYYQKTSGWWIFAHTDYVHFCLVDDGYQGKISALEKNGKKGTLLRISI